MTRSVRKAVLQASSVAILALLTLSACGGGGDSDGSDTPPPPPPPASYSIGGSVSGLSGTVILHNGSEQLSVSSAGSFTFPTKVADNTSYTITVGTQPASQTCTVTNGAGVAHANITNVAVSCVDNPTQQYSVGGTVSGLNGTLVLQNNLQDDLTLQSSGEFQFAGSLASGATYDITVLTQPQGQSCSVQSGQGTVASANVVNVAVTCAAVVAEVRGHRLAIADTEGPAAFALAVRADGTVLAWGTGMAGGAGTPVQGTAAKLITAVSNVTNVSALAGYYGNFSLATRTDGSVLGWGTATAGGGFALGALEYSAPTVITQLTDVSETRSLPNGLALALKRDGSLWAMTGRYDALTSTATALQIAAPGEVASLGDSGVWLGSQNGYDVMLPVVGPNGDARMLRVGMPKVTDEGALILKATFSYEALNLPPVKQASCGGTHQLLYFCLALDLDGNVWSWGTDNDDGQLGDGTLTAHTIPAQLTTLAGVTSIATSQFNSYALTDDGSVYSWGGDFSGSSGLGDDTDHAHPAGRHWLPEKITQIEGAVEIAVPFYGGRNAMVRTTDGSVWAWGENTGGVLGDGTTTDAPTPVQAVGIQLD